MQSETEVPRGSDRRDNDRRQRQIANLPLPDRRKHERRSYSDRREPG